MKPYKSRFEGLSKEEKNLFREAEKQMKSNAPYVSIIKKKFKSLKEEFDFTLTIPVKLFDGSLTIDPYENEPDVETDGETYYIKDKQFEISLLPQLKKISYKKTLDRVSNDELSTIEIDERHTIKDIHRDLRSLFSDTELKIDAILRKHGYELSK